MLRPVKSMSRIDSVVLVSGGMDSCVTAAIALDDLAAGSLGLPPGGGAAFLHVSYGQRTAARERRAFDELADFYQIPTRMVADIGYFNVIGGSALTDSQIEVPTRSWDSTLGSDPKLTNETVAGGTAISSIPITYVPFRNTHLLAIAVSWAEAIGAVRIYIGAVAEDSSGYPDCRPQYYQVFNELIRVGTRPETRLEVVTPVIHLRKFEIIERGRILGAPFHLTWSCYQNQDIACGQCDSCRLRLKAFDLAGMQDPVTYSAGAGIKFPSMGAGRI